MLCFFLLFYFIFIFPCFQVSYLVAHQLAYPYLRGLGIANTKLGIPVPPNFICQSRLFCILKLDTFFKDLNEGFLTFDCLTSQQDILRCSFLRNINEPAHFSFVSPLAFPMPMHGAKCPIFEDGPNFDMTFRVFHGRDGVVPLYGRVFLRFENLEPKQGLLNLILQLQRQPQLVCQALVMEDPVVLIHSLISGRIRKGNQNHLIKSLLFREVIQNMKQ